MIFSGQGREKANRYPADSRFHVFLDAVEAAKRRRRKNSTRFRSTNSISTTRPIYLTTSLSPRVRRKLARRDLSRVPRYTNSRVPFLPLRLPRNYFRPGYALCIQERLRGTEKRTLIASLSLNSPGDLSAPPHYRYRDPRSPRNYHRRDILMRICAIVPDDIIPRY